MAKKRDRSGKKGDDPKPEDKYSNMAGTTGAHLGDTISHGESTTPNRGASIGVHVLEANGQLFRPTRSVEEILGSHPMGVDNFWGGTNPSDVFIDTTNSKEIMAGSHITEHRTLKC